MKRSLPLLLGIAGLILAADQWTKAWATREFAGREPVNVIGELVRFTYTRNSGVAFGLGAGVPFPYALFSILAVGVILYLFLRHTTHSFARQLSLALILGGALGNLVDRVGSGEVVDFILVGWRRWYWPVFNVADSAVSVGVVLFGLTWAKHQDEAASVHEVAAVPGASGDGASTPSAGTAAGETPTDAPDPGQEPDHVPHAAAFGAGAEQRGAAGPLPRAGTDGPLA